MAKKKIKSKKTKEPILEYVRALGNRVLVIRDKPIEVSKGGIIYADNALKTPEEGIIASIGSEVKLQNLKLGDRVAIPTMGVDIIVRGKKYAVLTEDELYVKITKIDEEK